MGRHGALGSHDPLGRAHVGGTIAGCKIGIPIFRNDGFNEANVLSISIQSVLTTAWGAECLARPGNTRRGVAVLGYNVIAFFTSSAGPVRRWPGCQRVTPS
jgi:hypothetical protein